MNANRPATDDASKRIALRVGLLLAAVLLGLALFFQQYSSKPQGIGLSRLLHEEEQWRTEQRRIGRSINEVDLWEVQEEVAWRSEISREGVKGLVRRAANARDQAFRAEGLLLGGTLEPSAALNLRLATQAPNPFNAEEIAQLYRRAADAEWRGNFGEPAAHYLAAITALQNSQPQRRADLWMDLALWHWSKANFFPEDRAAELHAGLNAVTSSLALRATDPTKPDPEVAAAQWLRGNFLLHLAVLESDRNAVLDAGAAFTLALNNVDTTRRPEFRATILHDQGLAFLEQTRTGTEQAGRTEAIGCFTEALKIRNGKLGTGKVDVRIAERRLTQRAESLAARALALASPDAPPDDLKSALRDARGALELTLPDEPGPAWIQSKVAELIATVKLYHDSTLSNGTKKQEDKATVEEIFKIGAEALDHYPQELSKNPCVPQRAEIITALNPGLHNTDKPSLHVDPRIVQSILDMFKGMALDTETQDALRGLQETFSER